MVLSVVHSQINNNNNNGTSKAINSAGEGGRLGTQGTMTKWWYIKGETCNQTKDAFRFILFYLLVYYFWKYFKTYELKKKQRKNLKGKQR